MTHDSPRTVRFRDGTSRDLDAVHAMNQAARPAVGGETRDAMRAILTMAAQFRVAEDDRGLAGFLVAMTPEAPYGSGNFLWFRKRFASFVYVDRVVVRSDLRGAGLGRRFYEDLVRFARERAPMLTCEVNTRPRNEDSLRFHARMGFEEVGTRESEGGSKTVALLRRPLVARAEGDPPLSGA